MDIFDPVNKITYSCNCDKQFTLPELYYCNGCQKITCPFCITEEIDSYYCPNCLENMASAEAILNQNRCKKCYECPLCLCALTYNVNGDLYYLNCSSCHWNSLSIGMTADNPYNIKKEVDKSQHQEFTRVLELVQREARDVAALKDKNRPRRRLPTRQTLLTSPSVGTVGSAHAHAHAAPRPPISLADIEKTQDDKLKKLYTFPPITESFETILDHLYNITDLNQVSTLQQRFSHLQVQPPFIKDLVPMKKLLHTRRSKRCRKCDQLLIKPDLNFAAKIEFKRLRIAYATLPRTMIARPFQASENGLVAELAITNPLHTTAELRFSASELPHHTTKVLEMPPDTFIAGLPEEDEEDEHLEELTARQAADNPKFIVRRVKNKLFLLVTLALTDSERVKFGLAISVQFQDATAGGQTTNFRLDFDFAATPSS